MSQKCIVTVSRTSKDSEKVREEEYGMRKVNTRQTDHKQNTGRQTARYQPVVEMSDDYVAILKLFVEKMQIMERNYERRNLRGYRIGRRRGWGRGRGGQQK